MKDARHLQAHADVEEEEEDEENDEEEEEEEEEVRRTSLMASNDDDDIWTDSVWMENEVTLNVRPPAQREFPDLNRGIHTHTYCTYIYTYI